MGRPIWGKSTGSENPPRIKARDIFQEKKKRSLNSEVCKKLSRYSGRENSGAKKKGEPKPEKEKGISSPGAALHGSIRKKRGEKMTVQVK